MTARLLAILAILVLILGLVSSAASAPGNPGEAAGDTCGTAAEAAGGPDAFGYTFKDSAEPGGPTYAWVDISTTGTNIPFRDHTIHGPFPLGFRFNFYGVYYTQVWASSDGWLSVEVPEASFFANPCPQPFHITDGFIAALWDALDYNAAAPFGTGYYTAFPAGTCPYGGYTGACFIAQWHGMYHYASNPPDDMFFQIILKDNDNIVMQFQDASDELGQGSTTGIESPDNSNTIWLTYACNTASSLADHLAVEFYFPTKVPRLEQSIKTAPAAIYTGENIPYTITLKNTGYLTATGTMMTDPLPTGTTYVDGSVTGGATYNSALDQIEFNGDITPRSALTVTFLATADATSGNIINTATISQTHISAPVVVTATTAATSAPNITVAPPVISSTQAIGVQTTHSLAIGNTGYDSLHWRIGETGLPQGTQAIPMAWTYENGPLITHPGGGFGGLDASAVQTAIYMSTYGFAHSPDSGYRVADDFTIPAPGAWQVDTITFYAYQTGSTITPTINHVNLQIWNGRPGDPGAVVIWGDPVTNRLASSTFSSIYRVRDTEIGAGNRPIMENVVTVNTMLPPGSYWLDWQAGGDPGYSGPFVPPISILGQTTTGNARQWNGYMWVDLLDSGMGTLQGLPFKIGGSAYHCAGDLPWVSAAPISGTLAPGGNAVVDVTFDSTGLAPIAYTGVLCVLNNDPETPVVAIPLTMAVTSDDPWYGLSTKTAPASVYAGDTFTYTVVIDNLGLLTGAATTMMDPLPAGVTYVPGSVTGGAAYNSGLNRIEFTGDVAPRSAVTVTFMVTATATSGAIVNTATISQTLIPAPVLVTATTAAMLPPAITVSPPAITSTQPVGSSAVYPLTVGNAGSSDLDWQIQEAYNCHGPSDIWWLSAEPVSGTLAPGGNQSVGVTLNSTGMATGMYEGRLCVVSNDPDTPLVEIPVTMMLYPPTSVSVSGIAARPAGIPPIALIALAGIVFVVGAAGAARRRP